MPDNQDKILLIGASGMLGRAVAKELAGRAIEFVESDLNPYKDDQITIDIVDYDALSEYVSDLKPKAIINCSAYTDVDGAEENEDLATEVNGRGVGNIAQVCNETGSKFVHVSTDYVFNGSSNKPYAIDWPVAPQGAYGRSKLVGEQMIQVYDGDYAIVRTSWLFGPEGNNFVDTIAKLSASKEQLKVVNDQRGCPTYTLDLAKALVDLSIKKAKGIYHFSNQPDCTWYDLAKKIVEVTGNDCQVDPCDSNEYPRPAKRPAYSVMDCRQTYQVLGWQPRSWQEAVEHYLL